jgi:hypothetical protein
MTGAINIRQPIPWCWPQPPKEVDPKHVIKKFETFAKAQDWRRIRAGLMAKYAPTTAAKLHVCRKGQWCGSPACSVCWRAFRRWFAGSVVTLLPLNNGDSTGYAVTAIPTWLSVAPGKLSSIDLRKAGDRLRKALERSSLRDMAIVGGWDFSFNEHSNREWAAHWQPHLYDKAALKAELEDVFPPSQACPRPVKCTPLKNALSQATYAMKGAFFRRISFIDHKGHRNTRKRQPPPLRPGQWRELLAYLDQLAMTDRMFLRNVRRRGGRLVLCQRDRTTDIAESS